MNTKGVQAMSNEESSQPMQRQRGAEQGQPSHGKQANGESSRQQQAPAQRDWFVPSWWRENPFSMMQRLSTEMDRMFDAFGRGRGLFGSRFGRSGKINWSP